LIGSLKGRDYLEYLGVDGKIMLKRILKEIFMEGVDCINVAQGRDRWRAAVNALMILLIPQRRGIF
jgi:hypothetical protein